MLCKKTAGGKRESGGVSKGLFNCNSDAHEKPIHFECYKDLVRKEFDNKHQICLDDGKEVAIFVCGKQCYKNNMKVAKEKNTAT